MVFQELVVEVKSATFIKPGVLRPCIQAKRHGCAKTESGIFTDKEVTRAVAGFDRTILDRVEYLQCRGQFASCMQADFKMTVSQLAHALGDRLHCAVDGS